MEEVLFLIFSGMNLNYSYKRLIFSIMFRDIEVSFLLVLILLFFSCKKKEVAYIVENIKMNHVSSYDTILLSAERLELSDSCLMEPQKIWCVDSFLMIFDEGCKYEGKDFLRFYYKGTHKLWKSYGKIGRGPDEYISPHFLSNQNRKY